MSRWQKRSPRPEPVDDGVTPRLLFDLAETGPKEANLLLRQYREAKARHPGMLLLFRTGDRCELLDADALLAAPLLGLFATEQGGTSVVAFPAAELEARLKVLLKAGQRIAVCEPADAPPRPPLKVERAALPGDPPPNPLYATCTACGAPMPEGGTASGKCSRCEKPKRPRKAKPVPPPGRCTGCGCQLPTGDGTCARCAAGSGPDRSHEESDHESDHRRSTPTP